MSDQRFAFTKKNYIIMIVGIVVLALGFLIMSSDTEPYGFGFLGLTLGPIVVMLGFLIQFIAIFYKSKKEDSAD
jgi:ATP/ADP translocase